MAEHWAGRGMGMPGGGSGGMPGVNRGRGRGMGMPGGMAGSRMGGHGLMGGMPGGGVARRGSAVLPAMGR